MCHTTVNWLGATFNHTTTGFALTGAHTTVQCAQCHVNNNYSLTSGACANCHMGDYNGTTNPNHKASGFPTTCDSCHNTTSWAGATFDHSTTGFALTGAHTTVQCAQCHVNSNYSLTSGACANCHMTDYNGTTNPNHKASGFPTTCDSCHNTTSWAGATFNHATTGFPLTGAHTSLQCAQCHVNNNYNLTSAACINCHLTDYNGTTNPPHQAAGFPQDCSICHTTVNWQGATFNHTTTGFALTGAHTSLQCTQCHVANNYSLTSGACVNCHLADYNSTTNPAHAAAGFPTTCDTCHNTTSWSGATFNHATTGWALTGAPPPRPAHPAMWAAITTSPRRHVMAATRWITRTPPIPTTSRPGFPLPATPATPPLRGPARHSTTPGSLSRITPRQSVPTATPIPQTTRFSCAPTAIRRPRRIRSIRA